eukprot:TRINITY_DN5556_c0_g1_i1.p1 TRINITY_DN5556_c0_g1~~TRINITY_DN5556_c0_g1_i1.p1  ORF type:complete len:190 (+),score=56.34 TRINITY_DN5556_c0_g1_i1:71-640(+)
MNNYEEIDPIPINKTVVFLNNFIISTTQYLNRFSYLCEQKLAKVARDVQRIEITMSILETKLSSIDGIDKVSAPTNTTNDTTNQSNLDQSGIPQPPSDNVPPPPVENFVKVRDDERFKQFFKAIDMGAPAPQIEMRLQGEGINPSILSCGEERADQFDNKGERKIDYNHLPPGIGEDSNSSEETDSSEY